jgi:plastocyanin
MKLPARTSTCVSVALILLMCSTISAAPARVKPTTHTVTIEAMRFQPDVLIVKPGDSIVWVNKDAFPHTVTSQTREFDSQALASGTAWRMTARKKGEFPYVCTLHPTMKAVLRVR